MAGLVIQVEGCTITWGYSVHVCSALQHLLLHWHLSGL